MENLLPALESLLKRHDWYYDYSDDHGVWRKGQHEERQIAELMHAAASCGLDADAQALYLKHCPFV